MGKIINEDLQLVIFDVDGTLYSQSRLRKFMLRRLISYYMIRPWKLKELYILYHFRKERELKAGFTGENLEELQYEWCLNKVKGKLSTIKRVINLWIFSEPNKYLEQCLYPGAKNFVQELKNAKIKTAIYSDYKSGKKLKAMHIETDLEVSSTDPEINAFKPLPNGLNHILKVLNVPDKSKCIFIGDRSALDGLCAFNAGIPFLLVDKKSAHTGFYQKLSEDLRSIRNKPNDRENCY